MAAGVYDFTVEQGVSETFQAQYQNPDGSGKNLTGWVAKGTVKAKINDCEPLGELEIDILEPESGTLGITLPKSIIAKVKVKGTKHTDFALLVYDIKLWPANDPDNPIRLLNGVIKVSPEVTK